jgi:hypothetical protein
MNDTVSEDVKLDEASAVEFAMQFESGCRDCGDEGGTCPSTGMPCDPAQRRAVAAATKPPEEHETCALCGLPAPDGYVEFDADGEAMHPHCRDAATKPPLAGEVEEVSGHFYMSDLSGEAVDALKRFYLLTNEIEEAEIKYQERSGDVHNRFETASREELADLDAAASDIDEMRLDLMRIRKSLKHFLSTEAETDSAGSAHADAIGGGYDHR